MTTLRKWFRPMHEFTRLQLRATRIVGNISAQIVELFGGADEMIEVVLLPEAPPAIQTTVDLNGSKVLPRLALRKHRRLRRKGGEQMDVIRHHDEIGEVVAIAVKMLETVGDDLRQFRPPQHAGAVTFIQMSIPAFGDELLEFVYERLVEVPKLSFPFRVSRIDSVMCQPFVPGGQPVHENRFGNRIPGPPGDETDRSRLHPMRKSPLNDGELLRRVKDLKAIADRIVHRNHCSHLAPPR